MQSKCLGRAQSAQLGAGHLLFINHEVDADTTARHPEFQDTLDAWTKSSLATVVELTERHLLDDPARLSRKVRKARELGCAIALDDVGSNPESLTLIDLLEPDIAHTEFPGVTLVRRVDDGYRLVPDLWVGSIGQQ